MADDAALLRQRLQAHLEQIIRDRNPFMGMGHHYVQQYIQGVWAPLGQVEAHAFDVRGRTHYNWVLKLPGQRPQAAPILVGAHYDTVLGSPGADDNATGLAVLLELARHYRAAPPRSPLHLVAFDLEEYGLAGSRAYAQSLKAQGQPLGLMLSLEMLGYCDPTPGAQTYPPGLKYLYPSTADFIALVGPWHRWRTLVRLRRQLRQAGAAAECLPVVAGGRGLPDTRRSDHAPFWDQGYPGILVTDTANLRNPHYHRPSDRLDTLDLEFLTRTCQGLMVALGQL